jgi:hypothetical protein
LKSPISGKKKKLKARTQLKDKRPP